MQKTEIAQCQNMRWGLTLRVESGHWGFTGLGTFAYLSDQEVLSITDPNRYRGTHGLSPRPTHGGKGLYPWWELRLENNSPPGNETGLRTLLYLVWNLKGKQCFPENSYQGIILTCMWYVNCALYMVSKTSRQKLVMPDGGSSECPGEGNANSLQPPRSPQKAPRETWAH